MITYLGSFNLKGPTEISFLKDVSNLVIIMKSKYLKIAQSVLKGRLKEL